MKTYTTTTNSYKYFTKDFKFIEKWRENENIDLIFFEVNEEPLPENAEKIAPGVWVVEV